MERKSNRFTNGSLGWVDTIPCLQYHAIIEDLLQTDKEWNLYVCPQRNVRHSFVVHKNHGRRCFYFYDYQGSGIFEDQNFSTTRVFNALRIDKTHGFKVKLGQTNCIIGEDYTNLCMKNSAFVMKYKCAPNDRHFNKPIDNDRDKDGRIFIDLTMKVTIDLTNL